MATSKDRFLVKVRLFGKWVITWGYKVPGGIKAYNYQCWRWQYFKSGEWRRLKEKKCPA